MWGTLSPPAAAALRLRCPARECSWLHRGHWSSMVYCSLARRVWSGPTLAKDNKALPSRKQSPLHKSRYLAYRRTNVVNNMLLCSGTEYWKCAKSSFRRSHHGKRYLREEMLCTLAWRPGSLHCGYPHQIIPLHTLHIRHFYFFLNFVQFKQQVYIFRLPCVGTGKGTRGSGRSLLPRGASLQR